MEDKGNGKLPDKQRIPIKKGSQKSAIEHGLYANPSRWDLDGRTLLAKQLANFRFGLESLFPREPDQAPKYLVDRVVFKSLKLALYEATDLFGDGGTSPGAEQRYLQMSNSLREDIRLLTTLAKAQAPAPGDPDLKTYLESVKKAAKAQAVQFVEAERG